MLRAEVAEGTELGREAKKYMDEGDLCADEVIINMIKERLRDDDARDGFLLDGSPGNQEQADALGEALDVSAAAHRGPADRGARHEVVRRLAGRRVRQERRRHLPRRIDPPKHEGVATRTAPA